MWIRDFSARKAIDFSNDVEKVCLYFNRSVAECVCLLPIGCEFASLSKAKVTICMPDAAAKQLGVLPFSELAENEYDYVLEPQFLSANTNGKAKLPFYRRVAIDELGIEVEASQKMPQEKFSTMLDPLDSLFVAVCMDSEIDGCDLTREQAAEVCQAVMSHGYIPVEVAWERGNSTVWAATPLSVKPMSLYLGQTAKVLKFCRAYVGVCGAVSALATRLMPEDCLVVKSECHSAYFEDCVRTADANRLVKDVGEFLERIDGKSGVCLAEKNAADDAANERSLGSTLDSRSVFEAVRAELHEEPSGRTFKVRSHPATPKVYF